MKVLHISKFDIIGGAARAAHRLHSSLLAEKVNSLMLVKSKHSDDPTVVKVERPKTRIENIRNRILTFYESYPLRRYKNRSETLFSPARVSAPNLVDRINQMEPDIVHLHWITGGTLRPEDLNRINAPIVWSLCDMWPLTGGCHYDEECGRYEIGCGKCPILGSSDEDDLSAKVFERKKTSYRQKVSLTVIGKSRWITECASLSPVFSNADILNLPNPIDTNLFKPVNKSIACDLLNLPSDKKLVLFGAINATSSHRKGFHKLSKALSEIETDNAELVVFGSSGPEGSEEFRQKAHYLGRINENILLRLLYSAADVMIVPSIQENLSNAIIESLACGTPVIGFDIGGNGDMIDHKINGYLAKPYDHNDLAAGIDWVLNNPKANEISDNARQKVLSTFDSKKVARQYISLYKKILTGSQIKATVDKTG